MGTRLEGMARLPMWAMAAVGDTLVVEVNGFNDLSWFDRAGNYHSAAMEVVERYTPISPRHMMYEATIEDPEVFTRHWTIRLPLYRRIEDNLRLLEFKCVDLAEEYVYGGLANAPMELTGTVVRMEWVNPHTWIHIDVAQADGSAERWMIEGGAPTSLLRRGFTKRSLLAGTEVFVEGFQAKDGSNKANGRDVTFADGSKLFLGSSGTGAPRDGRDPTEPPR